MNKKLAIGFVIVWLLVIVPAVVMLVSKKSQSVQSQEPQTQQEVYAPTPDDLIAERKKRYEREITKSPHTPENLLKLVNAERAKVGVKPLKLDERLNKSAKMKVDDMVKYQYLAHKNHDGTEGLDFIRRTTSGYCKYIGENVLGSRYDLNQDILDGYLISTPHREAILSQKYTLVGIDTQFDGEFTRNAMHFCEDE